MRSSTALVILSILASASAAPIESQQQDKRWCIWGWGTTCHQVSSVAVVSSAKATSTAAAVAASVVIKPSAVVQSSAISSASAVKASSAAVAQASAAVTVQLKWDACKSFDWSPWSTGWSWSGYNLAYVKAWYIDNYGTNPPPGYTWNQVSALVSSYGHKTIATLPKSTYKAGGGCANPWSKPTAKASSVAASSAKVTSTAVVPASSAKASSAAAVSSAAASSAKASAAAPSAAAPSAAAASSAASSAAAPSAAAPSAAASSASAQAAAPSADAPAASASASAGASGSTGAVSGDSSGSTGSNTGSTGSTGAVSGDNSGSNTGSNTGSTGTNTGSTGSNTGSNTGSAGSPGTGSGDNTGDAAPASASASASTSAAPAGPTTLSTGYTSAGCFQEVEGRLLAGVQTSSGAQTLEQCTSLCAANGFQVAGLEYGAECYCGNIADLDDALESGECKMACSGNDKQICGGPNAINAFVNTSVQPKTVVLPAGWSSYGNVAEGEHGRALTYLAYSDASNSNVKCATTCNSLGYTVSGTEYSSECFCGNGFSNGGGAFSTNEKMPCSADSAQTCGGPNMLSISTSLSSIPSI